ncbi:GNAT family N-acetyltransferase [Tropicimonas isoalkanivorans]|uniref:Ribosomal protein S18 acetylase RimI n=1 Tax=Tropicimonas isoalkanivorans TaxID=441112 RepID=A0A1I1E7U2_9RHOB|nr:GNAT family N-acetyltransferase [Tropicimonas isoalkanivorans]SFB81388.1 Ribosomal protein S18 acetylase RimI [Tropicimonas isoalkanivorans]
MQNMATTAHPVRIRRAERGDAPALLRMVAALAEHHGDIATLTPRALERDLFGPSACASALLALNGTDAVGYAVLSSSPRLHSGRRVMEVHHLFVDSAHRGTGVGRRLMAAAVVEARRQDCGELEVGTDAENARAQAIYGSLGFAPRSPRGPRFALSLPAAGTLPEGWI